MDGKHKMTPANPEDNKPTKIIKGEVKEVKKGVGKKISEFFFEEDGKTVWRWVIDTCIKPGLIDLIYDIGVNTLRGRLYGTGSRRSNSSGSSFERNDYEGRFKSSRETKNKPKRRGLNGGFDLMEILDDHGDAEAVLDAMKERIVNFDCVTVGDYYDFLGKTIPVGAYTSADYGWYDLSDVSVRHDRNGFYIDLPRPVHLD